MATNVHAEPPELHSNGDEHSQQSSLNSNDVSDVESQISTTHALEESTEHQVPRRAIVNRIVYLAWVISLLGPGLNLWRYFNNSGFTDGMGLVLNIIVWSMFGIVWCLAFTTLLAPILLCFAFIIRLLDIVPALGSSLSVLGSNLLLCGVLLDGTVPFLNNLPLFSLIVANSVLMLGTLSFESRLFELHRTCETFADYIHKPMSYVLHDGKLSFIGPCASLIGVKWLSLTDATRESFSELVSGNKDYLQGRRMGDFTHEFGVWRRHARKIQLMLLRRRCFLLMGFCIESGGVLSSCLSVYVLLWRDQSTKAVSWCISPWIIAWAALCLFSDYLWKLMYVRDTFTSAEELRSSMLARIESRWFNYAGPHSGYLANRAKHGAPFWMDVYRGVPARELASLGIVGDADENDKAPHNVLRSCVPSIRLSVSRVGEGVVKTTVYEAEDETLPVTTGLCEATVVGDDVVT